MRQLLKLCHNITSLLYIVQLVHMDVLLISIKMNTNCITEKRPRGEPAPELNWLQPVSNSPSKLSAANHGVKESLMACTSNYISKWTSHKRGLSTLKLGKSNLGIRQKHGEWEYSLKWKSICWGFGKQSDFTEAANDHKVIVVLLFKYHSLVFLNLENCMSCTKVPSIFLLSQLWSVPAILKFVHHCSRNSLGPLYSHPPLRF